MDYQLSQSNIYIISPTIIYFISIFLVLLMVLWLTKRIFKDFIQKSKYFDHIIYLVRLPKERPGDETKEPTTQEISAHYPSAVIEEVDDYNIFKPNSEIVAGFLKTRRSFIYPIKTYQNHETDPMNSIINVLSKLDDEEGIAIQYVVRSARPFWHRTIRDITSNIRRGKSLQESISIGTRNKIFSVVLDIIKLFISKPKEEQFQQNSQIPRLTAMEEEMLKGIESKNGKAGLDVNLRIVVSAKTPGKASVYLNNLGNAFAQFNPYEYGNSFSQNIKTSNHDKIINSFIYRRYDRDIGFLLNTEELASLYHLPLKTSETPNILWLNAKYVPAPP